MVGARATHSALKIDGRRPSGRGGDCSAARR